MEGTMRDPQSHPHLARELGAVSRGEQGSDAGVAAMGPSMFASQLCPLGSHEAAGCLLTSPSVFLHMQKDRVVPTPWVFCADSTG